MSREGKNDPRMFGPMSPRRGPVIPTMKIPSWIKKYEQLGGSPGLVVMGRDSRSKGRGFESRHRVQDGHISHIIVVKIVIFV